MRNILEIIFIFCIEYFNANSNIIIWYWIFEYLRDLAQHIPEYEVGKNENWNSHFRNFRLISSRQPRCWCCTSQFREIDEALGKYNSGSMKKNKVQMNRKAINFFVYAKIATRAKPEGFNLVTCVSQKYLYSGHFLTCSQGLTGSLEDVLYYVWYPPICPPSSKVWNRLKPS